MTVPVANAAVSLPVAPPEQIRSGLFSNQSDRKTSLVEVALSVPRSKLWSAEATHVYTLVIILKRAGCRDVIQAESCRGTLSMRSPYTHHLHYYRV